MPSLRKPARVDSLGECLAFVSDCAESQGFSPRRLKELQLAVEEALVNITKHAYREGPGEVELRWLPSGDPGKAVLEIEDSGQPFDPRKEPAPDLSGGLLERKLGGLGIYFIKKFVDEVGYRREGGRNIMTLSLRPLRGQGEGSGEASPGAPPGGEAPLEVDLGFLLSSMKREAFRQGEALFKAGDPADRMFYLARGSVRFVEIDKTVKEGDLFGEMGMLSPYNKRTASAVCLEDVTAYTLAKDDVIRLFVQDSAVAFRLVHLSIERLMENLRAETEAKERVRSELRIARDIQASMLPRVFPPFPERPEFDVFAMMEPAEEVGGDFYDFFLIDESRLGVVIGDVSGKGVPAALFMAICKTLLKSESQRGLAPGEILARVNRALLTENEALMFVTVFLLILDARTGEVQFACAGHPPPFVSAGPGRFEPLACAACIVLGAVEGAAFPSGRMTLAPGDAVFLYTDGLTEAMDREGALFSEARLAAGLAEAGMGSPEALVQRLRNAVRDFAGGAPQSDDITMVALRFSGPAPGPRGQA